MRLAVRQDGGALIYTMGNQPEQVKNPDVPDSDRLYELDEAHDAEWFKFLHEVDVALAKNPNAFWDGLGPKLARAVVNHAVTFLVFDAVCGMWLRRVV